MSHYHLIKIVEFITDFKLSIINTIVLSLTMTNMEVKIKIFLAVVTSMYTIHKWYLMWRDDRKKKKEEESKKE